MIAPWGGHHEQAMHFDVYTLLRLFYKTREKFGLPYTARTSKVLPDCGRGTSGGFSLSALFQNAITDCNAHK